MNNFGKTLTIAILVFLASVAAVIAKTTVQKSTNDQKIASIEKTLLKVAQDINANTPTQIDKNTRLMNAVAIGNTLRYRYMLLNAVFAEVEKNSIKKNYGTRLRNSVCSSVDLKPIVELGVIMEYAYYDRDGIELEIVSVETSKCHLN